MGISEILASAAKARAATRGVSIRYQRGEDEITLSATPARTRREIVDDRGNVVQVETRDYLILATDLLIDSVPIEPRRHDKIIETVDGQDQTYEVSPVARGERPFVWLDMHRVELRVHAQKVN